MEPVPIYSHEYTITAWDKNRMGIQQIVITTVSENTEGDSMEAVENALNYFDRNLNISHRITLQGYKQA